MKAVSSVTLGVLLLAAASSGCIAADQGSEGDFESHDVGEAEEPIVNGTTVTATGLGYPKVFTRLDATTGALCSSSLLTNSWVLTSKHCHLAINANDPSYTTELTMDEGTTAVQVRRAVQIVNHPS